jgi:hypothetical protein
MQQDSTRFRRFHDASSEAPAILHHPKSSAPKTGSLAIARDTLWETENPVIPEARAKAQANRRGFWLDIG